ncbi:hypothetical protein J8J14_23980 [Roseomonas sp. SSH11]|uniref:DUF2892 domain-containing protein n=1 Tax=Pararoseomonas baculiformis TaxID=2820812 RepID=A0ABS4ALA5_9PROT|nr:hypothetical protein [Pararoseomonas baculiformis]MBP0447807.1 hypothetical protein [Pararoseomonas baculiformis]
MLPTTTARVSGVTSDAANHRIAQRIEESVRYHAAHPERIGKRLRDLDAEWDIERTLAANAATLALTGTLLGAFVNKRWLALPAVVTGFLLQHAVQGWCPPLQIFRSRGVRTASEIDQERYALKVLRGDFARDGAEPSTAAEHAEAALRAVRA